MAGHRFCVTGEAEVIALMTNYEPFVCTDGETVFALAVGNVDAPDYIEEMRQEDEEQEIDKLVRIEDYYGPEKRDPGLSRSTLRTFIFSTDDLDNEEVIAHVEVKPTCKRTKEDLKMIESKTANAQPIELEPSSIAQGGYVIGGF